jgi:hypothetical protein
MKWFLENARRRAGFALKNPRYALRAMFREFETAFPQLRSGGLHFSDDPLWPDSFYGFSGNVGATEARILRGVGFLRKNSA